MRAFWPTFMTSDHWSVPPAMVAFTFTKYFAACVGRAKETEQSLSLDANQGLY